MDKMDEHEVGNDSGPSSDCDTDAQANGFPVIKRRYEPVPDLDDRLRSIYALLSLPPSPLE